jgi:predicted RNA-binding protein with PUA-like domain
MFGEPFDSRDGIWNTFNLFSFSELSTAVGTPSIAGLTRLTGRLRNWSRKETIRVAYWLMKSEPESYGWADLVRDGGTEWDGVRNNAARLHLKAMKKGDQAFFYHSMSDKAVVGIVEITREAQPDPKDADWVSVRVEPVRALSRPVTLAEIKADPRLAKMELIRQSRLSVAPVRAEEWQVVLELGSASH